MNTYYFNNTARVAKKALVVVTERRFREIQDKCLCATADGSWNNHWVRYEAKNLNEAKAKADHDWF